MDKRFLKYQWKFTSILLRIRYTYHEPLCSMQIYLLLYFCTTLCPGNCHTVHYSAYSVIQCTGHPSTQVNSWYCNLWISLVANHSVACTPPPPLVWKTHSTAGWISVESTMSYAYHAPQKKIRKKSNMSDSDTDIEKLPSTMSVLWFAHCVCVNCFDD